MDLTEALRVRESLGGWEGARVTRHYLDLLLAGLPQTTGQCPSE